MVPVGGPTTVEFTSRLSLGNFLLLWVLLRGPIHFTRLLSYLQVHCVHQQLGKCALLRGHYGLMFYLGSTAISLPKIMIIIVATILNIVAPIILIALAPITGNFMDYERVLFSG